MIKSFRKNILTGTAVFAGIITHAQDATTTAAPMTTPTSDNTLLYLLIAGCAILLVAVILLGNVWINLTKLVLNKRAGKTVAVLLLLFTGNFLFAQNATPSADTSFKLPISLDLMIGIFVFGIGGHFTGG